MAQHLEVELEELLAEAQFLNSLVRKRRRRIELSQLKQDVPLLLNIPKPVCERKEKWCTYFLWPRYLVMNAHSECLTCWISKNLQATI